MISPADCMARALHLAELGRHTSFPNPRVGCVIVRDGAIVGEGWHERAGEPHAEVHALRQAGARARGAELFVSLEPCSHHGRTPPCVDAVIAAAPARVWVAMSDPNPLVAGAGIARLRAAGIAVETGLLEAPARRLNRGFVSRMTRGRPFLSLKLAMSLDGRTAMASGESRWITGEAARADVHRLRAEAGAVLTASGTVLADDPQLTVRLPHDPAAPLSQLDAAPLALRQPDRIVLDTRARVPASARVWQPGARRFWITAADGAAPRGVERLAVTVGSDGRVALPAALEALGRAGVNQVLVECGPRLAGQLLAAGLVDEALIYVAPSLLGDGARPLAALPGLERLDQRLRLRFEDLRSIGTDIRITAVPEEV